jgi:glycosyltransferase involved in cell wall biosynthesis
MARRLFFVNRFFYPDLSATSQILTDLARHLAATGQDVEVVCSRLSYDDPGITFAPRENYQGVSVRRLATTRFGRARLAGRALDYLSFYVAAFVYLLGSVKRGDVLVAKTDPPLIGVVAWLVACLKGAVLVNWLQDIFPEVAQALGVRVLRPPLGGVLLALRDRSLRAACANVALGERMASYLRSREVPDDRLFIIPNWADDETIRPVAHEENPLREEWNLQGKFVVAYSGNLGRAHDAQTLLDTAGLLAKKDGIHFLVIGGGAQVLAAKQFCADRRLANVDFHPYQARERLPLSLGAADLHIVSLNPAVEGLIVPSKFYGIAAAGRPVAFIGMLDGEIAREIARFDCGRAFEPKDSPGLASYILALSNDPEKMQNMAQNARRAVDSRFSRSRSLELWARLLEATRDESVANSQQR